MSTTLPAQRPRQHLPRDLRASPGSTRPIAPPCRRCDPSPAWTRSSGRRSPCWAASGASGCSFQGNAVRVGPAQFPKLWHLHNEVVTTFDWPTVPGAVRLADAVLQRRRLRHRPAVHRGPLRRDRAAGRRRAAGAALPRAGPRDERPRALSHHRRHPRPHQPRRPARRSRAWRCCRSGSRFSSGRGSPSSPPTAPGCSARRTSWPRSGST